MGIIAYAFGGIGLFILLDGAVLHLGIAAALFLQCSLGHGGAPFGG